MIAIADFASWAALVALLVAIAWIDLRKKRIPNRLNGLLLLGGLAASGLPAGPGPVAALEGALLGGAFLLVIAIGFRRLRGLDGLGLGDVKFLVAAGAWTGWRGVGPTIFIAATAALSWIALCRLWGAKHERDKEIAFGPYLCVALLTVRIMQRLRPILWE